jgi:hypothetical protein
VSDFVPLWKTPTRQQAVDILRTCRAWTDDAVAPLSAEQLVVPTQLGDGTWTVKDLLGHLATWEERALVMLGRRSSPAPAASSFASADDFNAHHLERKRSWSLAKVQQEYDEVRTELVACIEGLDDERWLGKIDVGGRRSALALVLAKMLNGDRFGYFAHSRRP